jgi:hypothetical protein
VLDDAAKDRVKYLCDQIATEQDHNRFSQLVAELNQLLEAVASRPLKSPEEVAFTPGENLS